MSPWSMGNEGKPLRTRDSDESAAQALGVGPAVARDESDDSGVAGVEIVLDIAGLPIVVSGLACGPEGCD